jgi:DNA-binding transcriptional MerR regulator
LSFIRQARELGFSRKAIRDLLGLSDRPDQPCDAVDSIAKAQLLAVERRIARLFALKSELERLVTQCAGGSDGDCRVIEVLGNHAHCAADHGRDLQ